MDKTQAAFAAPKSICTEVSREQGTRGLVDALEKFLNG